MKTIRNYYFKQLHDEPMLMSGANMPRPENGPFRFEDCEFHPRLWEALEQLYKGCEFDNCNWPR